jgi:hypothetical protein
VRQARRRAAAPLVAILREHIDIFGTTPDGRVFASERGQVAYTAISDVWAQARTLALTPEQVASPLAGRPYDLRHAAVSLWLNAGVPATEVAERAGTACKSCCASTGVSVTRVAIKWKGCTGTYN